MLNETYIKLVKKVCWEEYFERMIENIATF